MGVMAAAWRALAGAFRAAVSPARGDEHAALVERVAMLEERVAALEKHAGRTPLAGDDYERLQAAFRGDRSEVAQRLADYLPAVERAIERAGRRQVLDLGCGRGEWLRLLRDRGHAAAGSDTSARAVERCREEGLDVHLADALVHLGAQGDGSLGAVTAFHLLEHLDAATVLDLTRQAFRVLAPGGLFVIETPNIENVVTATSGFHFDPTHSTPLPARLLRFFVESTGFADVEVRYLHPPARDLALPDDGSRVTARFNDFFFGPQDVGVLAWKPGAAPLTPGADRRREAT